MQAVTITTESQTLGLGVAGSLVLHLLLFVCLALWMGFEPVGKMMETESAVTLLFAESVMPAEPEPEPIKQPDSQQFIRTSQNTESSTAPAKASFISDRNTVASAKTAPSPGATAPLPTTSGVNLPTMDLANRDYKDGQPNNDSAFNSPPAPPDRRDLMKKEESPPDHQPKKPEDRLPLEISKPGSIADVTPMLKAPDEDEQLPKAIPVPAAAAQLAAITPRPEKDAFQPETRTAQIRGSISDRGAEDAVNAAMTIEGKYMAEIQKAVGIKWHKHVRPQRDLAKPGIFTVHFFVGPDGSVKSDDITILSDKDNVVLESVAVKSILTAKIPPVPRELRTAHDKGFSAGINFLIGL